MLRRIGLTVLVAISALPPAAVSQEQMPVFGTTVVIPGGLRGQVYHLKRNTEALPSFEKLKSKGTVYTTSLNVPPQDFQIGFPGLTDRFEWFAIDYTGRFWIAKPGLYEFLLHSDDGARLYIDDQLIADNDGIHPPADRHASLRLTEGIHRIRVSYFQGPRTHVALVLKIAGPGEQLRVFSTDEFKPPSNLEISDSLLPNR